MVTKKKSSPLRGVPAAKDKDAALDAFAAGAVQPTIAPRPHRSKRSTPGRSNTCVRMS